MNRTVRMDQPTFVLWNVEVCGFGTDDIVHAKLMDVAQRKGSREDGVGFGEKPTVLIGDTVRDIGAALDGVARVIARCHGEDSEDALRQTGAHAVLPDFAGTDHFMDALASVRTDPSFQRDSMKGTLLRFAPEGT